MSLQDAHDEFQPGDVICMEKGRWENGVIITKKITFRDVPDNPRNCSIIILPTKQSGGIPPTPTVEVQRLTSIFQITSEAHDVTLMNLTVIGGGWGVEARGTRNLTLQNLTVYQGTRPRGGGQGGIFLVDVEGGGLFLSHVGMDRLGVAKGWQGSGVLLVGAKNFRLANNEIKFNGRHGVEASNVQGVDLRQNVITRNMQCGLEANEASIITGADNAIFGNRYSQDLCGHAARPDLLDQLAPGPPQGFCVELRNNCVNLKWEDMKNLPTEIWLTTSPLKVVWENPQDISEITAFYYKFGFDPVTPVAKVSIQQSDGPSRKVTFPIPLGDPDKQEQGRELLSVWLEDGLGNKDERNVSHVRLQIDTREPKITPVPLSKEWYNDDVKVWWACQDTPSGLRVRPGQNEEEHVIGKTITGEGPSLSASATCIDRADNQSKPDTQTVSIDRGNPKIISITIIPLVVGLQGNSKTFSQKVNVQVKAEDPDIDPNPRSPISGSGIKQVRIWNDDGSPPSSWTDCSSGNCTIPWSLSPLSDSAKKEERTVWAHARDNAGNESFSAKAKKSITLSLSPSVPDDFATIQAAINAVADVNGVVMIQPGTYIENVEITRPITLKGQGSNLNKPIVKGKAVGRPVITVRGNPREVTIENLIVTAAQLADGIQVQGTASLALRHMQVSSNGDDGIDVGGSAKVSIESSLITANGTDRSCREATGICNGIEVWDRAKATIKDTMIQNNVDWGIAARLRKCGFSHDLFTGEVTYEGTDVIANGQGAICLP
jgi:hypothetical protein